MAMTNEIFQGNFIYLFQGKQYSEEDFSVKKEEGQFGNFIFDTEILSRVKTGEFLKIRVKHELNSQMDPAKVTIMRFMGEKKSSEIYTINHKDKMIKYQFRDLNGDVHDYEKNFTTRFHIPSPSAATSLLMTQSKKIDPIQRTPYQIYTSQNVFDYQGPFEEKMIYLELMSSDPVPVKIHRNELTASLCHMFQHDKSHPTKEKGTPFYMSKNMGIPYLIKPDTDTEIRIDRLKSVENKYEDIFRPD